MWEMMDSGKSYDEKIKQLKKQFGFNRRTIDKYLAISRLSDTIKSTVARDLDIDTAAGISTADWEDEEKE